MGAIKATKVQNAQKNVMKTFLGSTVKSNVTQTVMAAIKRQVFVILDVNRVGEEFLAKKNALLDFMGKIAVSLVENVGIAQRVTILLEVVLKDVSLDTMD